jgi:ACR3 family arsenite transporter
MANRARHQHKGCARFGLQDEQIMLILLLAVPLIIQVYFNAGLAYGLNRVLGVEWCAAGPSVLIGASNSSSSPSRPPLCCLAFSRARRSRLWWACRSKCRSLSVVHIVRRSRASYEHA